MLSWCAKTRTISDYGNKKCSWESLGTWNRPFTHPHGKHAWTVREGTRKFEKIEVHLADVVLQVKCCGKVGLTVFPGANQHRLVGSMNPLVPSQQIHLLEHLLTHLTRKPGCRGGEPIQTGVVSLWPQHTYLDVWPHASEASPRCMQEPGSQHEGTGNLHGQNHTQGKWEEKVTRTILRPFENPHSTDIIYPETVSMNEKRLHANIAVVLF